MESQYARKPFNESIGDGEQPDVRGHALHDADQAPGNRRRRAAEPDDDVTGHVRRADDPDVERRADPSRRVR